MFVTMSATKSATNTTESATNATESATKPATDSATKDVGKANNITATIKDEVGGNGGKVGGDGGKAGGNGGINTDESVGYEADIIRYVRLHPNATQRSINTAIGVPLRTIQRIMSQLQKKGILIREGSSRLGQWKVID
jgi:hypothetical protein